MRKLNTPGVWRHVHYRRWQPTTAGDAVVTVTITALDKNAYLLRRGLWKSHQFWSQVFQDSCMISSVSKNRRHLWLQAIKQADWDITTIKEARVSSAHFISGNVKVILYYPFLFA